MLPWLALLLPALALELRDVPCCAPLDEPELQRARGILERSWLYDGCDQTVLACLAQPAPAFQARHVAGEVCRRVAAGEDDASIEHALELRARTMLPGGPPASIALEGWPSVGEADAPVVLVEYACARCPFCSRLTPELVEAIQEGPLRGKVRLVYKLFPIKGHEGSVEAALGALAAQEQGRFWDYLLLAYREFDAFEPGKSPREWAERLGLDLAAWDAAVARPELRARLVESKKEGIANGVDATPTLFLDGRRYWCELQVDELQDVLLEEYERLAAGGGPAQ